ncbi:MAG: type II toxin-antitoxin system PrlF family antitoxin [Magnetospirillum sp. WYHS-4]
MPVVTLTSKGQTTIPKDIRDHLGLQAGDKLRFLIDADGRVTLVPNTIPVKDLKGILPRPASPVSLDAMDAAIRKRSRP